MRRGRHSVALIAGSAAISMWMPAESVTVGTGSWIYLRGRCYDQARVQVALEEVAVAVSDESIATDDTTSCAASTSPSTIVTGRLALSPAKALAMKRTRHI